MRALLPWSKRRQEPLPPPPPEPGPLPRPAALRHEWLDVTVARHQPGLPPVGNARLVVRPWPQGAPRPLEPVARAITDAAGSASFHLPVGRYALSATAGPQARTVAFTLEHAGRTTLLLEAAPPLHLLRVEVADADGFPVPGCDVEARRVPGGEGVVVARTDARGLADLGLPAGLYDVRAADASALVEVASDARVRLAPR